MEVNPYTEFVKKLREDAANRTPVFLRFGKVTSADPLKVEVSGTIQEKTNFLKDQRITSFEKDDSLLLLPIEEEQRFIIICKVVGV